MARAEDGWGSPQSREDMYPVDFDMLKPIGQRTYHYLRGLGIG